MFLYMMTLQASTLSNNDCFCSDRISLLSWQLQWTRSKKNNAKSYNSFQRFTQPKSNTSAIQQMQDVMHDGQDEPDRLTWWISVLAFMLPIPFQFTSRVTFWYASGAFPGCVCHRYLNMGQTGALNTFTCMTSSQFQLPLYHVRFTRMVNYQW